MNADAFLEKFETFAEAPSGVESHQEPESMRNVSRENILEMPPPVPPLAEQKRIVAKVDQLLALCNALTARQEARAILNTLLG